MSHNEEPLFAMNRASPLAGKLIAALLPHASVDDYPVGHQLPFSLRQTPMCYLLLEGTVAYHRGPDGLVVSRVYAPALVAIVDIKLDSFRQSWLETMEPCQVASLSIETAYAVIREQNLWEELVGHLTGLFAKFYHYHLQSTSPSAYEIIRYQLMELLTETEEFRAGVTMEKYIRSKTNLSRSGIMKILANLKTGGYIEVDEGRLVKVHKLPAKY